MNLYLVSLQKYNYVFYVVAENAEIAYKKVEKDLVEQNYGFTSDRQLNKIELLAEVKNFPDTESTIKKLYL